VIMVEQLVLWIRVQDQAYTCIYCASLENVFQQISFKGVDEMPAAGCFKVKRFFTLCVSEKDKRLCGVLNVYRLWMDVALGGGH
jgi:hypothetical protein